jgi:hypothetical protein
MTKLRVNKNEARTDGLWWEIEQINDETSAVVIARFLLRSDANAFVRMMQELVGWEAA